MSHNEAVAAGRNFISPRGLSGVGWGLPAAIGAKLGNPDKKVYCLTGDGGFGYVMNELETAARYNVKIITVVFNNSILGFQKHWEKMTFGKTVECDLSNVDYSRVAEALGCLGERVEDPNSLKGAFEEADHADRPYVIDVVIDPNSIPPAILFNEYNG
jgi:acetolactate synthase-1/2/3 large subunit